MNFKIEDEIPTDILSEKEMAIILVKKLFDLGYQATTELVLDNSHFSIEKLTEKSVSKVRIDVAAHKNGDIIFIEVENGLWLTHPTLYREFAHRVFLACPYEITTPTDNEQLEYAEAKGIGVIKISANGTLFTILPPQNYEIPISRAKAVISLINRKNAKE
ncbi:MAG: hypothetical protein FK734_04215 [Asgard group archaeon]|nr:hypothetical protein [Asgard group archaeon]